MTIPESHFNSTDERASSQPLPFGSRRPPEPPAHVMEWELSPSGDSSRHLAARGFWQAVELHPATVGTAIVTDSMCSAIDIASLGITAPFLWLIAGLFNGVIAFLSQRKWGGDDAESAFIKALIVAFLVGLPTPFPAFLTVPSGIVGLVRVMRRKRG